MHRRGLLRSHRNFRLLWLGETVSSTGSAVTFIALPLTALGRLHANTFEVATLTTAQYLPTLLIGLLVGAWVDRLPKRPVMLAADLVSAAALMSVPLSVATGGLTLAQLYAVAFVVGLSQVFFQTAYSAYLPVLVTREQLVEGNGALEASRSAAQVAGPGLAGLVVQAVGTAGALAVDALSFCVSAVSLRAIRTREAPVAPPVQREPLRAQIAVGLRYVLADPVLRVLTLNAAVANLALTAAESVSIVFLSRTVGLSAGGLGGLLAVGSAGGVVGAVLAAPLARRLGTARATLWSVLVTAPVALLIPLTRQGPRLACFVVGFFVLLVGVAIYNVTVMSYRQAATPPELLGRVTASMRVALLGTIPLGGLLGGALGQAFGTRTALWVAFTGNLVPGLVLLASPIRRLRDLPAP